MVDGLEIVQIWAVSMKLKKKQEKRANLQLAKEKYMRDWDIEGSEYDPNDFEIEIVEV